MPLPFTPKRAAGRYRVGLVVGFSAEYRLGAGEWVPVDGVVLSPANSLDVVVGTASTVLVGQDCTANPHGPGC